MELAASPQDYWTESRRELSAWFHRNAASLGELYEGSLKMLHDQNFPGKTRFIAHAVREIKNRLPDAIAGPRTATQLQYKNRLDDIMGDWQAAGLPLDGSISLTAVDTAATATDMPLPISIYRKMSILLKDHIEARERPQDAAYRLFEAIAPKNQELRDTLRPIIIQWMDVTGWFMGKAHDNGSQDNNVAPEELSRRFELFEATLGALARGFFKTIEGLDEILEDANS